VPFYPRASASRLVEGAGAAHNSLPVASEAALTPKQYLYLTYDDVAERLDDIIQCESGWQPTAKNRNSTATGLCQFIRSTWVSTSVRMGIDTDFSLAVDPYENIDRCAWLFSQDGYVHWVESAKCWKYVE
jgi:hypothetical protein